MKQLDAVMKIASDGKAKSPNKYLNKVETKKKRAKSDHQE
jgi:hypothetical protein